MSRRRRQQVIRTNHAYKVDGLVEFVVVTYKVIAWLCRLLFKWRTEVGLIVSTLTAYGFAARQQLVPAWLPVVLVVVALGAEPWSRRLVLGRLACARARRRVLACCRNTGVMNVDGKLPFIARSRSTPVGERLTLWLRPGQSAEMLEHRAPELRAACHAREAFVLREPGDASRVVIEVIRHDPFTAAVPVSSPLLARAHRLAPRPIVED
jgi:hypothetical protein